METAVTRLRNAEALGERLAVAEAALGEDGAVGSIDAAIRELQIAAKTDPSLAHLADLGAQAAALVADLNAEIADLQAGLGPQGQAVMALQGTVDYFVNTVFNYPTLAECYKVAALNAANKLIHV